MSVITEVIIKKLYWLSGNFCAFHSINECEIKLINDDGNNIGQICHNEGDNEGSARYNMHTTKNQKNDSSNLIVLCPNIIKHR